MQHWDPERDLQCCQECGSHVSPAFRRACGDEDDIAHRCTACDTRERISKGSAAGIGLPNVDPLDDPSRFSTTLSDLPANVRGSVADHEIATDGGEEP